MDKANAKLAQQIGEFSNTSGKRNADIVIAIVRLPPVAVHAVSVEVADIHEVAVRLQRSVSFMLLHPCNSASC